MYALQQKKKVLIVVRTYPTPSKKDVEVSCTAGITESREWIRLFPVPYRFLAHDKRFRKYQWIEVAVRPTSDARPESHGIYADSIKILSEPLSTANRWQARKDIISPMQAHCLCCLKRSLDDKGFPTLGFFRPKCIQRLVIEEEDANWTQSQLEALRQGHLFEEAPVAELEKVPFKFLYEFLCNDASCPGHTLSCTDWEMGESWRRWRQDYGDQWEAKFRQRYELEMLSKYDTHLFVGTLHNHPKNWIIVGLFYPPRQQDSETLPLFR